MKTAEELAKEFDNIDFVRFIQKIQKEAWNEAIDAANKVAIEWMLEYEHVPDWVILELKK